MAPPAVTPETTETTEAEKEFELQAPPEGKRPRTPNELDNPAEDAPLEVESEEQHTSIPSSPKAAASGMYIEFRLFFLFLSQIVNHLLT
uniref:GAGE domain-containing protein n=1 Tax=Heterorhabditis bacteriophora TaxID=37862 RepID=A0A1I7X4Y9_HETBA